MPVGKMAAQSRECQQIGTHSCRREILSCLVSSVPKSTPYNLNKKFLSYAHAQSPSRGLFSSVLLSLSFVQASSSCLERFLNKSLSDQQGFDTCKVFFCQSVSVGFLLVSFVPWCWRTYFHLLYSLSRSCFT